MSKEKKFLYEIDVRMVKRVVVTAKSKDEALAMVESVTVDLRIDDNHDNKVVLLGDSPKGDESGWIDLLAAEGSEEWKRYFGGVN